MYLVVTQTTLTVMTSTRQAFRTVLNLIVAAAFAAALAVPALTHAAPVGGWHGEEAQATSLPTAEANVPQWDATYAEQFPGCTGRSTSKVSDLVIYTLRGDVKRVDFGQAWDRNHNATADDDVWVVGWCAG